LKCDELIDLWCKKGSNDLFKYDPGCIREVNGDYMPIYDEKGDFTPGGVPHGCSIQNGPDKAGKTSFSLFFNHGTGANSGQFSPICKAPSAATERTVLSVGGFIENTKGGVYLLNDVKLAAGEYELEHVGFDGAAKQTTFQKNRNVAYKHLGGPLLCSDHDECGHGYCATYERPVEEGTSSSTWTSNNGWVRVVTECWDCANCCLFEDGFDGTCGTYCDTNKPCGPILAAAAAAGDGRRRTLEAAPKGRGARLGRRLGHLSDITYILGGDKCEEGSRSVSESECLVAARIAMDYARDGGSEYERAHSHSSRDFSWAPNLNLKIVDGDLFINPAYARTWGTNRFPGYWAEHANVPPGCSVKKGGGSSGFDNDIYFNTGYGFDDPNRVGDPDGFVFEPPGSTRCASGGWSCGWGVTPGTGGGPMFSRVCETLLEGPKWHLLLDNRDVYQGWSMYDESRLAMPRGPDHSRAGQNIWDLPNRYFKEKFNVPNDGTYTIKVTSGYLVEKVKWRLTFVAPAESPLTDITLDEVKEFMKINSENLNRVVESIERGEDGQCQII
jgi:hypothetical protein